VIAAKCRAVAVWIPAARRVGVNIERSVNHDCWSRHSWKAQLDSKDDV
jgi:hypothetical protein